MQDRPVIEHTHEFACTACPWTLPPLHGGFTDDVNAEWFLRQNIAPHIDTTGHAVRVTISTRHALALGWEERSSHIVKPRT
jgi:hypothetical protein